MSSSEEFEILKKWDTKRSILAVTSKGSLGADAPEDLVRVELDEEILRLVSLGSSSDRWLDLTGVEFSLIPTTSRMTLLIKFPDDGRTLAFDEKMD
jgi:hypothetical protein